MEIVFKLTRIRNKILKMVYLAHHPQLWGKEIQLSGIPKIWHIDGLTIGKHVSLNDNVYLQCVGGAFSLATM